MGKYKIEGNIDFYSELYKSLDNDDSENNKSSDIPTCLITNLPLTTHFVELQCGHKFNYIPLYNDIVNHKLKFNTMESSQSHLKKNQIRCPYCRKKQDKLLPFYEDIPGIKKIEYVNYINHVKTEDSIDSSNCKYGKCLYSHPSPNFNPELPESEMNTKTTICGITTHLYKIVDVAAGEYKYYCYTHKKAQTKENALKIKEKAAQEKKELKQKEKEEKKKAKEELKNQLKLAKKELKQKKNETTINNSINSINSNLNVVIQNSSQDNTEIQVIDLTGETEETLGCVQILKSGVNKGNQCGLKTVCNHFCKRHYKVIN
jgi:hypothetical protein